MRRLAAIRTAPRPAWQRDRLRRWLHEWELDRALRPPASPPAGRNPPDGAEAATSPASLRRTSSQPLAGEIWLLPPVSACDAGPVYVLVMQAFAPDRLRVAPFGRFAEPAVPAEFLTERGEPFLRVLCLWNARTVPAAAVAAGWRVETFGAAAMVDIDRTAEHVRTGQPLPDNIAVRAGPPLLHPLDPRHTYLEQERARIAASLRFGTSASAAPYDLPGEESGDIADRRAAEDHDRYGADPGKG